MSDGRYRIPIGALLVALIAGIVWLDHGLDQPLIVPIVLVLLGSQALREYLGMNADRLGRSIARVTLTCGALTMLTSPLLHLLGAAPDFAVVLLGWLLAAFFLTAWAAVLPRWSSGVEPRDMPGLGNAWLGLLCVALPMTLFIEGMYRFPAGLFYCTTVAVGCKLNDIGGYLVGSSLPRGRRHSLSPGISPNKSVEGALGGLLLGCVGLFLLYLLLGLDDHVATVPWVTFSICLCIAAQLGDLFESAIKRSAGCKDSGALLPAFGGAFDLLDSFIFAAPFAYLFGALMLS